MLIHNGKKGESLNSLPYKKYYKIMAMSLSQVDPKLSAAAASFHSKSLPENKSVERPTTGGKGLDTK